MSTYDHKKDDEGVFFQAKYLADYVCSPKNQQGNFTEQDYMACLLSGLSPRFRSCMESKKSFSSCSNDMKLEIDEIFAKVNKTPNFSKYSKLVFSQKDYDYIYQSQEELEWQRILATSSLCNEERKSVVQCVKTHGKELAPQSCPKDLTNSEYCFAAAACYTPLRACMKKPSDDAFVDCMEADQSVKQCIRDSYRKAAQISSSHKRNQDKYINLAYRESLNNRTPSKELVVELQQTVCQEESVQARACIEQLGVEKCSLQTNALGMCVYAAACAKQVANCLNSQDEPQLTNCFSHHEATKKCITKL